MKQLSIISRNKKYCDGLPRLRGHRLTTRLIKGYFDSGWDVESICKLYDITRSQVLAAVNFKRRTKLK